MLVCAVVISSNFDIQPKKEKKKEEESNFD